MSRNKTKSVLLVGVGGQGTILASKILTTGLIEAGYDVKMSEVHGMSQRGGSIASDVRFAKGEEVQSPMIPTGEADYLVVFDETQVVVNEAFLKQGGVLLTPADIDVSKLENVKALNVAMLGKLSKHFDFTVEQWMVALNKLFAEKFHEGNKKAFMLGREG